MQDFTFITGNQHKVDHLTMWLGRPVQHYAMDLDEIQSLDPHHVAEHKVRQAYSIVQTPVLVEDVSLTFEAMGRLPGTYIKSFLEEMGTERLCRLADGLQHRRAHARVLYAFYDGSDIHYFEHVMPGSVANQPEGDRGFGWDPIFIPQGAAKTYAQMAEGSTELEQYSVRAKAVAQLKNFLESRSS